MNDILPSHPEVYATHSHSPKQRRPRQAGQDFDLAQGLPPFSRLNPRPSFPANLSHTSLSQYFVRR